MSPSSQFFANPSRVFTAAILFRLILLVYGRFQDAHSPVKYTDIDYLVFTDAARFVAQESQSPYARATYRYTPLLAWLLYPTAWGGPFWFDFGKVLFAAGDVVTGWLIMLVLRHPSRPSGGMSTERALRFASIWLLNPMVANISTRGSSEGLLAVVVVAVLWAVVVKRDARVAGALLGLGVHLKIYPFVYAASVFWWMDEERAGTSTAHQRNQDSPTLVNKCLAFFSPARLTFAFYSLLTFMGLNVLMYHCYGTPFWEHTYAYHLTRIDHRHNFSVYNTLLHLNSALGTPSSTFQVESLAFIPQLLLSLIAIPLVLAKKDLASTMLAQTFAFVTFNKVCTSQYFLWYMVFLPFYLPNSVLLSRPRLGVVVLAAWVAGQAAWLQQAYQLEFLGKSTFVPGLWLASMTFFAVNIGILCVVIADVGGLLDAWKASGVGAQEQKKAKAK